MRRALDLLLVLAIALGAYVAWRTGRERAALQAEYDRAARAVGDLAAGDPSRVQVLALDTGEPLHFAWRIHVPPDWQIGAMSRAGGGSSSWGGSERELIARVRFREDDGGQLQVYATLGGGSSLMGLGDRSVADLIRNYGDRLKVEQLGRDGVAVLQPGKTVTLVKLTFPEAIREEARKALSPSYAGEFVPVFYELTLTPKGPTGGAGS